MYILHRLQRHASGFHDFINFLNLLNKLQYSILFGTTSQSFGTVYLMDINHTEQFLVFPSQIEY